MRSSCPSIVSDDFPFVEEFSNDKQYKNKLIDYDPQLANLIKNQLGLNHPESSRKNPWGNLSYAELIDKAIENSHQQRLTLSQIYSWIILYIPYFTNKSDKQISQGWKNSIRHNLSLHHRFIRIPNETPGKSSWWTIDYRAKQIQQRRKTSTKKDKSILQDMLKSSSFETSNNLNSGFNILNLEIDHINACQSPSENQQIISLKTKDSSNPLFHQMVLTVINKSNLNYQRDNILSTPPPLSTFQF